MARGRGFSPPDIYCTMAGEFIVHAWPVPLLYQGDLTATDHQEVFERTGVRASIHRMMTLEGPLHQIEAARKLAEAIIHRSSGGVSEPRPEHGWEHMEAWGRHGYAHRTQQPFDAHAQWQQYEYIDPSSSSSDGDICKTCNSNEQQEEEQEDEEHEEEEEQQQQQQQQEQEAEAPSSPPSLLRSTFVEAEAEAPSSLLRSTFVEAEADVEAEAPSSPPSLLRSTFVELVEKQEAKDKQHEEAEEKDAEEMDNEGKVDIQALSWIEQSPVQQESLPLHGAAATTANTTTASSYTFGVRPEPGEEEQEEVEQEVEEELRSPSSAYTVVHARYSLEELLSPSAANVENNEPSKKRRTSSFPSSSQC